MDASTVSIPRFAVTCFLVTGVPFGLLTGALTGFATYGVLGSPAVGASVGAATAVLAGATFGIAMTAILGVMHRAGARLPSGALADVHQSDAFNVQGDLAATTEAAVQALAQLGVTPAREVSGDVLVLWGRTSTSWKSWGEIVRIELGPPLDGVVPVHVTSRPTWRTTIADYGKNLANVAAIRGAMGADQPART
ncbi:MAG: hypothetical protein K8T90_13670 [Planctomycetes bacterium]|nr:hypothetical protein [Planctomycetota bacterium]